MLYDLSGNAALSIYKSDSQSAEAAYTLTGVQIFPDSFRLKVMTYNVGGWYKGSGRNVPAAQEAEYYALQTDMIQDNDPDVLVIQEYLADFSDSGTSALTMLQSLFPYVYAKTSGTYFGRAICSKFPISNYVTRVYTQETNRYFDSCTITIDNVPITFVNTHLGLTQANRDPEIAQLIGYLGTLNYFVACGDYNTAITVLDDKTTEEWIKNIKPFLDAGFRVANCDDVFYYTSSDIPDGTWNGCLDNIITSSNITILSAEVDETKRYDDLPERIDHMPFIAELLVPYASA